MILAEPFSDFVAHLRSRYGKGLPGQKGQFPLKPYISIDRKLNPPVNKNARKSAVLALLYPIDGVPHMALIQRPEYGGVHSGQISFPGGKVEEEDKSLLDAALRESNEEVGVEAGNIHILGPMTEIYVLASNFIVYPFIGYADHRPDFIIDEHEVAELLEVPFGTFLNEDVIKEKVIMSKAGFKLNAPYFDVDGRTLWGATAMMISEIVELVK